MSKEKSNKAFHLLEERGYVEKEINKEQCFIKTTDMGQFCFFNESYKESLFIFYVKSYPHFILRDLDYDLISEKSILSLENSAILLSSIIEAFPNVRYKDNTRIVMRYMWRIRRVVSNNGTMHKFMLDARLSSRHWVKYKEITLENINEIKTLVKG